jgi:hypothetical protein
MEEAISASEAEHILDARLPADGGKSDKIAAYLCSNGRQLALSRGQKTSRIWLEIKPPAIAGVSSIDRYASTRTRTSNLNASRGSRLAKGNEAYNVEVSTAEALEDLLRWYASFAQDEENPMEDLCLLGTWKGVAEAIPRVAQFIEDNGAWASAWSFRIKDDAMPLLKPEFWIYFNSGGNTLVARALVNKFVTAGEPSISPWPEQTFPEDVGKTSYGDRAFDVCRTWLRVIRIELLPEALSTADFRAAKGMSTDAPSSLLNQGSFGYAYRRPPGDMAKTAPTSLGGNSISLNTILYGPPGTSKTYETIDYALKIIDPAFAAANAGSRTALKKRFDELRREGRIEFLTFHQSYSYEDFVEGIKASAEGGVVSYRVEDGVFKQLCIRARVTSSDDQFRLALDAFKSAIADEPVELKTKRGDVFTVWWPGGSTLRVRPHAGAADADYPVSLENIARRYRDESETDMYNLSYVRAVFRHVTEKWHIKPFKEASVRQPYVMIIDEINRGNIASIFGELITLIEPSKRHGREEELTATLPYSKVPGGFSVPDNLFIIGTMNTADRSLSRIDTALRRRFEFVPMYPQPELLDGVMVDDIDVGALLRAMNERIELLYDRDHLLGHAFFMSLAHREDKPELAELAAIFRSRVIPLLEEYFFDDWARIRLVLADDVKSSTDFQFVLAEDRAAAFAGNGEAGGSKTAQIRFRRNDEALMRTQSYRQTYAS